MRHFGRTLLLASGILALVACPSEPVENGDAGVRYDAAGDAGQRDVVLTDVAVDDVPTAEAGADAGQEDALVVLDAAMLDVEQIDTWEPSCEDECEPGSQVCNDTSAYRICGQYDADPCLELSPSVACGQNMACSDGHCAPNCQDQCPASGSLCQDADTVLACGNFDTDACLDLGAATSCGAGKHCEAGACVVDGTACADECSSGATECFGDAVRTCGQFDSDSCLDWGEPVPCATANTCAAGACTPFCQNECAPEGASICVGNGVSSCGDFDADSCLEWGPIAACEPPEFCSAGTCAVSCTHECESLGAMVCSADGTGVSFCGEFDGDPCRDLSTATPCPGGYSCSAGVCIASCTNDCNLGIAPRCATEGMSVETCGNFDDDVCTEWGGAVSCPGGAACADGSCATPCTDDCTSIGETLCVDGQNATHTCGYFDQDSCRDWTSAEPCAAWENCSEGQCLLVDTPAKILINEIVYDAVGGDTNAGTTLMLELWGPAGQSLDGYSVVGVNGNDGDDYQVLSLDGEVMGQDGFYLIAYPGGDSALVALAEMTSSKIDFQNGPDSVQVRWHDRVVDALAYGSFTDAQIFAGEGTAAPGTGGGKSLTRDANHTDTDDNSADFIIPVAISPRANPAACTNDCNSQGDTQCSGQQIQTCVSDADADPCLEWSASANCPVDGEVCDGISQACVAPTCSDECTPPTDSTRCGGTGDAQISACVTDADSDPCYEWSSYADCAVSGQVCMGGQCSEPCTSGCDSAGVTQCAANGLVQTCGNYDTDICLEWSAAAACPDGQTCIGSGCQVANAPEVRLIDPQGTVQSTQGKTHRMLVDATAAPGRSIVRVEYYADGSKLGETTAAPHEYYFTVPAQAVTGSTIALQAKAVDDQDVVGLSSFAYLNVLNDHPVADFTATVTNFNPGSGVGTAFFDATACSDTETAASALEVCWDWDNDGSCDTAFATEKTATHEFNGAGTYTVRAVVRDAVGQTAETTRDVTFTAIQYLGGVTIGEDSLWVGTIIVTGEIDVANGTTLTVAEGTQILFVYDDNTGGDSLGDHTLTVNGTLLINGSSANPVVISGQDSNAKKPGGWDRIILAGDGNSSLSHVIIEYAQVGLELRDGSTLNDVTVRNTSDDCIQLNNADNASLANINVNHCAGDGVAAFAGSTGVTIVGLSSDHNGAEGISVLGSSTVELMDAVLADNSGNGALIGQGSSLDLSEGVIEQNTGVGLFFKSSSVGAVTHNQIRQNGDAGVIFLGDVSGNPNPVITFNNIYSNATLGSTTVGSENSSSILAASYTCCSTTGETSATYTSPEGTSIRRVYVRYIEDYTYSGTYGYLENGETGSAIRTFSDDFEGWVYVPTGVTQVRVRVRDSGGSYSVDSIVGTTVEYTAVGGSSDVVAILDSNTVNMQRNYLGTFPNVLGRVSMNRVDALDLRGFVGELYDSTWDPGPYKSGSYNSESWTGNIYITGDLQIPAGQSISVDAGAAIQFVGHDQDQDGEGDFTLTALGAFDLTGVSGSPVVIGAYGAVGGVTFQTIALNGSGSDASDWSFVNLSNGYDGVTVSGDSVIDQINVSQCGRNGVSFVAADGATLSNSTISDCSADGVVLDNADNCSLSSLVIENNALHGVYVSNASTGTSMSRLSVQNNAGFGVYIAGGSTPTIEDSTIRDNGDHGVNIEDASPTVNYSLISYNAGAGFWVSGSGALSAQHNIVKYNGDAGFSIWTSSTENPTPTIQYSNIYGNAVSGNSFSEFVDTSSVLTASYTCCSSTGETSATYTAPAETEIRRVYIRYIEDYTYSGTYGYLENAATGSAIRTFSDDFEGWVYVPTGVTQVQVRVRDSGGSYSVDSIVGTQVDVFGHSADDHYELVVITDSGLTSAKYNYWTPNVGEVPTKIFQARSNSVDYSGYTGAEYDGATVGPRP